MSTFVKLHLEEPIVSGSRSRDIVNTYANLDAVIAVYERDEVTTLVLRGDQYANVTETVDEVLNMLGPMLALTDDDDEFVHVIADQINTFGLIKKNKVGVTLNKSGEQYFWLGSLKSFRNELRETEHYVELNP